MYAPIIVKQGTTVIYPVKIRAKIENATAMLITLKPLAMAAFPSAMFLSSFSSISISFVFLQSKSQAPVIMSSAPIKEVPTTTKSGRGTGSISCTPKPYDSNPPYRIAMPAAAI